MSLLTLAKLTSLLSSGLFAGYTWSLSSATIPSILAVKDEASRVAAWRVQFIQGFLIAAPATLVNIISYTTLAVHAPTSLTRALFIAALLGSGSGTVFAWTLLRATNGALAIRAQKLVGDWDGFFQIPLTYSSGERASVGLEKRCSTGELIERWGSLNLLRSGILVGGFVAGVVGVVVMSN